MAGFQRIGFTNTARRGRKRKNLVLMGAGFLGCSIMIVAGVVMLNSEMLQASAHTPVAVPVDENGALNTVYLVAPAARVEKGAKVSRNFLRTVVWPRDKVPEGSVRNFEDIENMYATTTLVENEPISRRDVSPVQPMFSIAELLPPGHRAMSVSVDKTSSVEGWAKAGSHVDVILSYTDPADQIAKTRVAIENAVVLSLGGRSAANDAEDGQSGSAVAAGDTTVTLGVSFMDVLKLQQAITMGRINLVLRGANDIASPGRTSFDPRDWDGSRKPQVVAAAKPAEGFVRFRDDNGNQQDFTLSEGKLQKGMAADPDYSY